MPTELKIVHAEMHDDLQKEMTLRVHLHNTSTRTMHAYSSVRALRYDPATKTLEVQLSDRGLQEMSPSGNFILPSFMSVDPQSEATLTVSLPRTIARLAPGQNQIAPIVEELPAYQAEHVDIEVAFSSTPFYRDPRPKTRKTPRKMMVDWAEGHVKYRLSVRDQTPRAK